MFGDLFAAAERRYLGLSEALLMQFGYAVHIVYLNRAAAINLPDTTGQNSLQQELHRQYIDGGLNVAVQHLGELFGEEQEPSTVVAFSMGGYAAWLASGSLVPKSKALLLSSTRLRLATTCIDGIDCRAVFGKEDQNAPGADHVFPLNLKAEYVEGDHEFYKNLELCGSVIRLWLEAETAVRPR